MSDPAEEVPIDPQGLLDHATDGVVARPPANTVGTEGLDEPADAIYIRYVGEPALNNFRVYAHCVDDEAPRSSPVTITHVWREGDEEKTATVSKRPGETYLIRCRKRRENVSVTLSIPSGRE